MISRDPLADELLLDVGGNVDTASAAAYTADALYSGGTDSSAALASTERSTSCGPLRLRHLVLTSNQLAVSRALGHAGRAAAAVVRRYGHPNLDLLAEAAMR